jgi:hypothetical protein
METMNNQISFEQHIVNELLAVRAAEENIARSLQGRRSAHTLSTELSDLQARLSQLESLLAGVESAEFELQVA